MHQNIRIELHFETPVCLQDQFQSVCVDLTSFILLYLMVFPSFSVITGQVLRFAHLTFSSSFGRDYQACHNYHASRYQPIEAQTGSEAHPCYTSASQMLISLKVLLSKCQCYKKKNPRLKIPCLSPSLATLDKSLQTWGYLNALISCLCLLSRVGEIKVTFQKQSLSSRFSVTRKAMQTVYIFRT